MTSIGLHQLHQHAFIFGRQCSVCMETLDGTSDMSAAPCGHVFHAHCLLQWLSAKPNMSCPQCRQPIPANSIVRKLFFVAGFDSDTADQTTMTKLHGVEAAECERKMQQLETDRMEVYGRLAQAEMHLRQAGYDNAQLAGEARGLAVENMSLTSQLTYLNDVKSAMENELNQRLIVCQQLQANCDQFAAHNSALVATCERQSEHINRLEVAAAAKSFYSQFQQQPKQEQLPAAADKMGNNSNNEVLGEQRCIVVRGLSCKTEETALCDMFQQFGPVDRIQIVYGPTGITSGIAFICMQYAQHAAAAKEILSQMLVVDGRKIAVDFAKNSEHAHHTLLSFRVPRYWRNMVQCDQPLFHIAGCSHPE